MFWIAPRLYCSIREGERERNLAVLRENMAVSHLHVVMIKATSKCVIR